MLCNSVHQSKSLNICLCRFADECQTSFTTLIDLGHDADLMVSLFKIELVNAQLISPQYEFFILPSKLLESIEEAGTDPKLQSATKNIASFGMVTPGIRQGGVFRVIVKGHLKYVADDRVVHMSRMKTYESNTLLFIEWSIWKACHSA